MPNPGKKKLNLDLKGIIGEIKKSKKLVFSNPKKNSMQWKKKMRFKSKRGGENPSDEELDSDSNQVHLPQINPLSEKIQ